MSLIEVRFTPRAARDIERVNQWYEAERAGLGAEFQIELWRVLDLLVTMPEMGPIDSAITAKIGNSSFFERKTSRTRTHDRFAVSTDVAVLAFIQNSVLKVLNPRPRLIAGMGSHWFDRSHPASIPDMPMIEILFIVEEAADGGYTARAIGTSIFTEAENLDQLRDAARDAVRCHFEGADRPKTIRLHLVRV